MAKRSTVYAIGDRAFMNLAERMGGSGSGTGGTGGGIEARVAKLEACIEHIQRDMADVKLDIRELRKDTGRDFRILFGAIIAAALGLAGIIAKGFHWF
jgi:hypothetical protein